MPTTEHRFRDRSKPQQPRGDSILAGAPVPVRRPVTHADAHAGQLARAVGSRSEGAPMLQRWPTERATAHEMSVDRIAGKDKRAKTAISDALREKHREDAHEIIDDLDAANVWGGLDMPAAPSISEWLVISVAWTSIVTRSGAPVSDQTCARPRIRVGPRVKQPRGRCDRIDHPKRRGVRRDRPERRILITHRPKVGEAVAAVGEHDREITHDAPRLMPGPPLPEALQTHRSDRARQLALWSVPIRL